MIMDMGGMEQEIADQIPGVVGIHILLKKSKAIGGIDTALSLARLDNNIRTMTDCNNEEKTMPCGVEVDIHD